MRTRIVTTLALLACLPAFADDVASRPGRLPEGIAPIHYDIHVEPDSTSLTLAGRTSIEVQVVRATDRVTVNALDLAIQSAKVDGKPVQSVTTDAAAQTATLQLASPLPTGRHRIEFVYTGKIYQTATGLFAVDYGPEGSRQRMLTTQFEVADARRFAPMWDEPTAKATFTLEAVIPAGQSAYSNMPVAKSRLVDGKQVVRFERSPKMSSYLLHLTVGDLERISRKVAGVDIGVVTRRGASAKGQMSLDAAAEILPWYNEYFGTPYPLPKLDMIAVPGASQFFGAMENWGAIMYFEPALLVDPSISSDSERMEIYAVVAHEMAHQWFGDLVTMNWWDELWLNEGYATWMETKVATTLHPEWDIPLAATQGTREYAMQSDVSDATHPIVQRVDSVEAASQSFDSIAYNKGSAVIRMLESTVGEQAFRAGIRSYMRKYAYGNAVTEQLWQEIAAASPLPVLDLAHDFTLQPGVPLVGVTPGACVDGHSRVELTQTRLQGGATRQTPQTWTIPVRLTAIDTGRTAEAVLKRDGAPVSVDVAGCGPFVANAGQAAYYRTRYADAEFARLHQHFDRLANVDRLGLLNDASSLAQSGVLATARYLELADAVAIDSHPYLVMQLAGRFAAIDRLMQGSPQLDEWRRYARARLRPAFDRLGWSPIEGESQPTALLREELLSSLGTLADPDIVREATARFRSLPQHPEAVVPSLRNVVMEVAARHADAATWEDLRQRARATEDPRVQRAYYRALGNALDPDLARRTLELALSSEVPVTTGPSMVQSVALVHPTEAFRFAVAHDAAILGRVDESSRWGFIPSLAYASYDAALADEVDAYVQRSTPQDARVIADRAIASARVRSAIRARQLPELEAWLAAKAPAGTSPAAGRR